MIDPNQHDRFVLRQKWTLVINRYFFSVAGQESQPFCFVEQKRFAFKEDIRFFSDESKTQELMRIKARVLATNAASPGGASGCRSLYSSSRSAATSRSPMS